MCLTEQWHSTFNCWILSHHLSWIKLRSINMFRLVMTFSLLDRSLVLGPSVLLVSTRVGKEVPCMGKIRNSWLVSLWNRSHTAVVSFFICWVFDMKALFLILNLWYIGCYTHNRGHWTTLLLNERNILIDVHTLGLLHIQEKLLSMTSDLSPWSCLDMWLNFLPVFAK